MDQQRLLLDRKHAEISSSRHCKVEFLSRRAFDTKNMPPQHLPAIAELLDFEFT